jgi:hypothetical protein
MLKDFGFFFFERIFLNIITLHGEIFEFSVILLLLHYDTFFNVNGKATM